MEVVLIMVVAKSILHPVIYYHPWNATELDGRSDRNLNSSEIHEQADEISLAVCDKLYFQPGKVFGEHM